MSEWDEAPIYSSNMGGSRSDGDGDDEDDYEEGEYDDEEETTEQERYHKKNRLREFVRNFRDGEQFTYRDQLLRNHRRGEHRLEVDLAHLAQFDDQLLHWLKTSPNEIMALFEVAAREALGLSISVGEDQLQDVPHCQVILATQETAKEMRNLHSSDLNKLVVIPGIIISASRAKPKATSIAVTCVSCGYAKQIKLDSAFGGGEAPTRCWNEDCPARKKKLGTDNLVFLPDRAVFVDQQTLKLQEAPEMVPTGEMPRSMLCSVSNWLVDLVSPGMRVSIIGVSSVFQSRGMEKSQHHVKTPYLKVLGISMHSESSGRSFVKFTDEEEEHMLELSRSSGLYDRLWKSIAPSISGSYTVDIKKAIACLLFGGSRKRLPDGAKLRGDINLLLLGDPSTAKSQFLKFVERVAPVGVYTSGKGSSAAGLTASVVKDARGEFYLEGGAMILADGGVVCIDEFDKMREQDRVAIHECMEQQTISIAKAGITTILNSRTSVLAAANPVFGTYNDSKSASDNIDFLPTILSRFDMIFIVRDIRDADKDRGIAKHVLGIHVGFAAASKRRRGGGNQGAEQEPLQDGDLELKTMKKYIAYCRTRCAPSLNPAAAEMLRNHYVGIREEHRRLKQESAQGTVPITVRQLEAIIRISESLAKMTLSPEATPEHVAEAIRLFKVSTLNAAQNDKSSVVGLGSLSPDQAKEIQRIEEQIQRMVPIGSVVPTKRLQDDFVLKQGYNAGAVNRALHILVARNEFAYLNQQRHVKRIR